MFRIVLAVTVFFVTGSAYADMGRSPTVSGVYVSVEGAYLHQRNASVRTFGLTSKADSSIQEQFINAESGLSGGFTFGYAENSRGILGYFDRVEASFSYATLDASIDGSVDFPASDTSFALTSLGQDAMGTFWCIGGDFAFASLQRENYDWALNLERDLIKSDAGSVTLGLSPFFRSSSEDIETRVSMMDAEQVNTTRLDGLYYGANLTFEPEYKITPNISLIGIFGGGAYGYSMNGRFQSDLSFYQEGDKELDAVADVSDKINGFGFKALLGAALKMHFSETSRLTSYLTADYWSHIGLADLTTNSISVAEIKRSEIGSADVWEIRTGFRYSVSISD